MTVPTKRPAALEWIAFVALVVGVVLYWSRRREERASSRVAEAAHDATVDSRTAERGVTAVSVVGDDSTEPRAAIGDSKSREIGERADAERNVSLLAIDASSHAVSRARVLSRGRDGCRSIGSTDPEGRLRFAMPDDAPVSVIVRHADYALTTIELPPVVPEQLVAVMHAEGTIRGTVKHADGAAAGEGFRVVAWDSSVVLPRDEMFVQATSDDPGVLSCITDARGAFELRGLDVGKTYSVMTGGRGLLTGEPKRRVVPDGPEVELVLSTVYALSVHYIDADTGAPIRLAQGYLPPARHRLQLSDGRAQILHASSATAIVAGVPRELLQTSAGDQVYLFTSKEALPWVGPFHVECAIAGYEPATFELTATPIDHGIEPTPLMLHATSPCFGALDLVLQRSSAASQSLGREGPSGKLVLYSETDEDIALMVDDLAGGTHRFDNIPCGTYEARFSATPSTRIFPMPDEAPKIIEIGAHPASFVVDLGSTGSLELDVVQDPGAPYWGPLSIMLLEGTISVDDRARGEGTAGGPIFFCRAPYVVHALTPKMYSVAFLSPGISATNADGKALSSIEVRAGDTATLRCRAK